MERAGRAESRRRGEMSGCFEKVHTLLALCTLRHPPPTGPALLFARSPTLQPLYQQWRLRCCIVSLTRGVLLDYDTARCQSRRARAVFLSLSLSRREIDRFSLFLSLRLVYFIYGSSVSSDVTDSFCGYRS